MIKKVLPRACVFFSAMLLPMVVYAWSVDDLAQVLANLQKQIPALIRLIVAMSYVIGIAFCIHGVHRLKLYGDMRTMMSNNANFSGPMIQFFIGVALIFFPTIVDRSIQSVWGYSAQYAAMNLSYPTIENQKWKPIADASMDIMRLIGYIAFLRGWVILARLGNQGGAPPGTMGKGIIHIIGGLLGINILGTLDVLRASL